MSEKLKYIEGQPFDIEIECPHCSHRWIRNRKEYESLDEVYNKNTIYVLCSKCKRRTHLEKFKMWRLGLAREEIEFEDLF